MKIHHCLVCTSSYYVHHGPSCRIEAILSVAIKGDDRILRYSERRFLHFQFVIS